jgi:ribose 5-phosphate isomerase A
LLREGGKKHGAVITEAGNIILDVTFEAIGASMERDIKSIVGVVESGIFMGYAAEVIVGNSSGVRSLFP